MAKIQRTIYLSELNSRYVREMAKENKRTESDMFENMLEHYQLLLEEKKKREEVLFVSRSIEKKLDVSLEVLNAFLLNLPQDLSITSSRVLQSPTLTEAKEAVSEHIKQDIVSNRGMDL
ncbi:hypothetical protein FH008_06000 [Listeria monocytogenes]|nr:hypothetical protein [Listeria monocytogenes]HAO6015816.1 hypothetical protein [Listeria monocytogenes]